VKTPILVIEDEEAMRLLLTEYLEYLGYRILAAPDGRSAIRLAARETISLALVDINLPDMSGVEVMRRLRGAGVRAPFVIVSGNLRESYADQIEPLGVEVVMEKPVDLDDLERVLAEVAGKPDPPRQATA
jgi:CheY-like chemotaxis protein